MKYVVWDWNGTLLDDTGAALATLNIMLARRGLAPVDLAFFRANFAFPARAFYNRIGMEVPDAEWEALAREYHDTYFQQPKGLNVETRRALETVRAAGRHQALLSALRQDLLEADLARYGVATCFDSVYGVDNLDGGSKLARGHELKAALVAAGVEPQEIVMIGDAIHDWEVAESLGVRCVLCAQGSHSFERLAKVAPTGKTLLEAVELALGLMRA